MLHFFRKQPYHVSCFLLLLSKFASAAKLAAKCAGKLPSEATAAAVRRKKFQIRQSYVNLQFVGDMRALNVRLHYVFNELRLRASRYRVCLIEIHS